jgi:DNA-binding MarR family transcriptional regulator
MARDPEKPLYDAIAGLRRLADLFERRRQQLARSVGLSDAEWRVLEEISSAHFMPSLFAQSRAAHPAAVSRVLRQLQDRGLVRSAVSEEDGRRRTYELTGQGRRLLDRLRTRRERAIDAVWRGLPRRELQQFARFSEELSDRLESLAEAED